MAKAEIREHLILMNDGSELQFFSEWLERKISRNHLPHWQQEGNSSVYFVTWRLGDSIPREKLNSNFEERKAWKNKHSEPWDERTELEYHRLFSKQIDRWMDAGFGACFLREIENAEIVRDSMMHFEGERTVMQSLVVMPNHVHALFALHRDWSLDQILHSWKSFSAKAINRRLSRDGPLWQKDYFDRIVRDMDHFRNCVRYIRRNPEKAKLRAGEYILWESDTASAIE